MIKSFADSTTEDVFHVIHTHDIRKKMSSELVKKAEMRLDLLNSADSMEALHKIPSIKAEAPVRDAHGKYSIPIDQQWRVAFVWNDGPEKVEMKNW
jgi:plasmid maintenance system killer protein